ncbi:MAG: phosphoserine transaminase [Alphaproteobacteria bacterium]
MTHPPKPAVRPANPHFASGPCAKPPGWEASKLSAALTGRYHRSEAGRARLQELLTKARALLGIPESHRIAILPGSDTGAIEAAMWNLLGPRGLDVLAFDYFGQEWARDAIDELRLPDVRVLKSCYGEMPDLSRWDPARDLVFPWTGTTAGVCVPGGDWIPDTRQGLTICDATAAVFAADIPWDLLDAATFSWQKAMGGEAQHGMLVLGPRAIERLLGYTPAWPVPKLFRLKKHNQLDPMLWEGGVINTPSMLCVEDALFSLAWIESIGGLRGMIERAKANRAVLDQWISQCDWVAQLPQRPEIRPTTPVSMCLEGSRLKGLGEDQKRARAKAISSLLETEGVAFDINAYRTAPPGLRVWTGGTVELADISALPAWLDWAFETTEPGL